MKRLIAALVLSVALTGLVGCSASKQETKGADSTPVPLKEAKLNIEHNATDKDTGFQGAVDSEGWQNLVVTGPDGAVLRLEGQGSLGELGLTELFFETVEPLNADVSIEDMLKRLPEGEYTFEGAGIEAGKSTGQTRGIALLTHDIPSGPVLLAPEEGAKVSAEEDLRVSWEPVSTTIEGASISIIAYQLIVEKDEEPDPHMIGTRSFSVYLPPETTSIRVPKEFLEPATPYLWEVLAIEESGNQTLSSSDFSTR
jgi:hypothetical protein